MGAQGFSVAWAANNVSEPVARLDAAGIRNYDITQLYPITDSGVADQLLGSMK